jgi:hypothetical protein
MDIKDYLDQLTWEYAQLCQRKDGSIYGIASGKQCRKGKPISYNPNDKKLGVKQGLKQAEVTNKDRIGVLVTKAKAIGLTNKEIRSIKEEVKVELNKKKVQGTEALKLFAKKANQLAKDKKKNEVIEGKKPTKKAKEVDKPKPKAKDFPDDLELNNLEFVKNLSDSGRTQLVRDPKTGKEYVRKTGNSPDHIREQFYAEEAYRALGAPIPKSKLYDDGKNPVKLSEYVPEAKAFGSLSGKEREDALEKIKESFAADALMGNRNFLGEGGDNILVDKNGKVWKTNVNGSLRLDQEGKVKEGDNWNEYPTELWSNRESDQGKKVFSDLNIRQISDQIRGLDEGSIKKALDALPEPLKNTVARRIEEAQRIAKIQDTLTKDEFKDEYVDEFTKQSLGLRNSGIVDKLSNNFTPVSPGNPYELVDENGNRYDLLRGEGSIVDDFDSYVSSMGGDPILLANFLSGQAGYSWSDRAVGLKYWFANQQNVPIDSYLWLNPETNEKGSAAIDYARRAFSSEWGDYTDSQISKSFAALQAFTYEQLQRYDMPNNYRNRGTIGVIRTIKDKYVQGHSVGDEDLKLNQGILESYSMFSTFFLNGDRVIVQEVPHHRVVGMFLQRKPGIPGSNMGLFSNNFENEILVMQRGISATYLGNQREYPDGTAIDVENRKIRT